ncbi:hypothetical protein SAMD00019534_051990 [Acytostelium subglobosum LB1]|uniref:hypothetical protein n=1 Tax=Acytostelium subglobosum LB1 TaxID=1410327 RepID=UPI000644BD3B|nr:hypothetical protein SAMD00019534_051990 [Acytostelium subglobosum LB1]GAM22024.1 hypothetical protein SAMD00019534_051990 [Acytostelium subglobosum LB1]|eukprot:XP_012755124.1 hypothetical protein SAMD00019534_051990 [Acytostelium subglobosum LB1]
MARKIQIEFSRNCPVVSQVNSLIHSIAGNNKEAKRIQLEFLDTLSHLCDNIPIVGHGIGLYHLAKGNYKRAEESFLLSTRSLVMNGVIMFSGGVGYLVAAGIAIVVGASYDCMMTLIQTSSHGKFKPVGVVKDIDHIIEEHKKGNSIVVPVVMAIAGVALDGVRGVLDVGIDHLVASILHKGLLPSSPVQIISGDFVGQSIAGGAVPKIQSQDLDLASNKKEEQDEENQIPLLNVDDSNDHLKKN